MNPLGPSSRKSAALRAAPGHIRSARAILVLLTGLNLVNYVDRTVMAAVLSRVQSDLRLSSLAAGSLATVFLVGYFVTSPIFGVLADRSGVGRRQRLLAIGIAVWSTATVASGLVRSAAGLFVARALVGVGEASYVAIAPTFIDASAAPARRARSMSVFSAAIPVGSALGYVIGGAVLHTHGWRAAFFVAGAPGLALALLCLLIVDPPESSFDSAAARIRPYGSLRGRALYGRVVAGYCAYTFAIGGFAFWGPKYLHARYGLDEGYASVQFGTLTVVAGLVGTLVGGWLGDAAGRESGPILAATGIGPLLRTGDESDLAIARRNVRICAGAAALGAPLAALAILATTARGFFLWAFPCEAFLFLLSGPVNVAILRSVPAELRATGMATSVFLIHLFGDLWSPPLLGLVADHAPMSMAMFLVPLTFVVAATIWATTRASTGLTRAVAVR
ncbi:MAG: MFS transporter [Polyangiaceae bacterium]